MQKELKDLKFYFTEVGMGIEVVKVDEVDEYNVS